MNGNRGVSESGLNSLQCIGTTFKDNASVVGGTGTDNTILLGCISDGSGSFRAAAGNDQIANNIVL